MAKQSIFLGTSANDGTGSNLRAGGTIINQNFDEIYSNLGDGTNLKGYINFLDSTSTVYKTNIGAELAFFCEEAGFWLLGFLGSELGSGAINATFTIS